MGYPESGVYHRRPEDIVIFEDGDIPLTLDTPVYRYLPVDRFLEMIEKGINVLSHITHWDDPFEAFVFRAGISSQVPNQEQKIVLYEYYKNVYGQSWMHYGEEQDVIWRAYCPNKDGVRIKTTVHKLCRMVEPYNDSDSHVRIGKIKYLPQNEFDSMLAGDNVARIINREDDVLLDLLMKKREEFSWENEVRLVGLIHELDLDKNNDTNGSLLKFKIEPEDFVEEVLADPRMDRRKYEQMLCRILHRYPEMWSHVSQSRLYEWPDVQDCISQNQSSPNQFWHLVKSRLQDTLVWLRDKQCPRVDKYWYLKSHKGFLYSVTFARDEARIELYINTGTRDENVRRFESLLSRRSEIENELNCNGGLWRWEHLDGRKGTRIGIVRTDVLFADRGSWDQVADWFAQVLPQFINRMNRHISTV